MQGGHADDLRGLEDFHRLGPLILAVESLRQAIQGLLLPVVDLAHMYAKLRGQLIGRLLALDRLDPTFALNPCVYRLLFIGTLV
jgi:hypothetical protein